MSEATVKFIYSDLLSVPDDGNRYEIFEGELIVSPSPGEKHQNALSNLFGILYTFIRDRHLGKLYTAPLDVYFDDETVVEPDVLFISNERKAIIEEQRINGAPDLIVEIISPKTESRDRGYKYRRYEKEDVKEYWIVDPENKTLEIYILKNTGYELLNKYTGNDTATSSLLTGLEFNIKDLWI